MYRRYRWNAYMYCCIEAVVSRVEKRHGQIHVMSTGDKTT